MYVITLIFTLAFAERVKILHMSDTHGLHRSINLDTLPDADILIHTGDFTENGSLEEWTEFDAWLGTIKHKFKEVILILGNHEWNGCDQEGTPTNKRLQILNDKGEIHNLLSNARILHDEQAEIFGLKIFGSAWNPAWDTGTPVETFDESRKVAIAKIHGQEKAEENTVQNIPENVDVLLTHYVPEGIFDMRSMQDTERDEYEIYQEVWGGSKTLKKQIELMKPKVHLCGHVHSQPGVWAKINGKYEGGVTLENPNGKSYLNFQPAPDAAYPCQIIACTPMASAFVYGFPSFLQTSPRMIVATRENSEDEWNFEVEQLLYQKTRFYEPAFKKARKN